MIEIILSVISISAAIIFFIVGRQYGIQHSKQVINELKEQKGQNSKLTEKVDQLNHQNEVLNEEISKLSQQNKKLDEKFVDLKKQYDDQTEILEKSYQAISSFKQQNIELSNKIDNLDVQIRTEKPQITASKKKSEVNKLIADLALYGAKQWGKKKIDEWLYPED